MISWVGLHVNYSWPIFGTVFKKEIPKLVLRVISINKKWCYGNYGLEFVLSHTHRTNNLLPRSCQHNGTIKQETSDPRRLRKKNGAQLEQWQLEIWSTSHHEVHRKRHAFMLSYMATKGMYGRIQSINRQQNDEFSFTSPSDTKRI